MNKITDPKYQIFISSTYIDLTKEREEITKQILKNYHFPIGMEMFAASDKKQWEVVKKTIDSSDIYILILGYRYGSIDEDEGISYTEKEYNYAVFTNKPIIVFVKKEKRLVREIQRLSAQNPLSNKLTDLYANKYDKDQTQIEVFRNKAMHNRLVNSFEGKNKIDIQNAISEKIKELPLGGWVRKENIHSIEPIMESLDMLGIYHIRASKPTPRDDAEKSRLFRESREIKIIQYNGSRFFEIFKDEIASFLTRPGTQLKVLLAGKESAFYEENSKMVADHFSNLDANKNLIDYAKGRLESAHADAQKANPAIKDETEKLTIKHFNTQMRSPMIIFDNIVSHITLTYAPAESLQAFEIEIKKQGEASGYLPVCIKHFDRIWEMV